MADREREREDNELLAWLPLRGVERACGFPRVRFRFVSVLRNQHGRLSGLGCHWHVSNVRYDFILFVRKTLSPDVVSRLEKSLEPFSVRNAAALDATPSSVAQVATLLG